MTQKVVLATISLHNMAGGLERNIIRVANYLSTRGHDVHLVTFDTPDAQAFFPLASNVSWHRVGEGVTHGKIGFFERLRLIGRVRYAVRPPSGQKTTLIAFHHGILARLFLASFLLPVRVICSERNGLAIYEHITTRKWNLNFALLALASAITVQFPGYIKDYPFYLRGRIRAIPNVVEAAPVEVQANPAQPSSSDRYTLLAVGRLCAQKNYNHLINAFAQLALNYPNWDLRIVGEGALRPVLQKQIDALGLGDRVLMPGTSRNMSDEYRAAHVFCMPSKWEGFPNALAEALAHGLPSVGYERCAGVRDLIQSGENGLLAAGMADEQTLGMAMAELMSNAPRRSEMGKAAINSVAPYVPERVLPQWEELVNNA